MKVTKVSYRLLIVDDEIETRDNIANYIESLYGFEIYQASSGEEAWEVYLDKKPNIIITDIKMDGISGLDLIEKIRKVDDDIYVVILSAFSDKEKLLEAIKLNLIEYLIKPITRKELNRVLQSIIKKLENKDEKRSIAYFNANDYYELETGYLIIKGEKTKILGKQEKLLNLFISSCNGIVSNYDIKSYVYDDLENISDSTIRTLMKNLRKRLPENSIDSIYGEGYRLNIIS